MKSLRFSTAVVMIFTVLMAGGAWAGPPPPIPNALKDIYDKLDAMDQKLDWIICPPNAPVPKTWQTFSLHEGDDGYWQMGATWPDPRFTDNTDGTVTDNLTGLIWTQDADLFGQITWVEACDECNDLEIDGINDWRLPNVRELQSVVDYGQGVNPPPLPLGYDSYFENVRNDTYWSSSSGARPMTSTEAWTVQFTNGNVNIFLKTNSYYVWCVRGGQ